MTDIEEIRDRWKDFMMPAKGTYSYAFLIRAIRDIGALLKELDRIHQAVRDYDHEELRKAIEKDA